MKPLEVDLPGALEPSILLIVIKQEYLQPPFPPGGDGHGVTEQLSIRVLPIAYVLMCCTTVDQYIELLYLYIYIYIYI